MRALFKTFTPLESFTSFIEKVGFKAPLFLTGFIVSFILLFYPSVTLTADMNYQKGLRYYRGKNYKNAVVYFEKYAETQPDPSTYYMLGYAFYKLKDFEKSRIYFDKAYFINPDFTAKMISEHVGPSREEQKIIDELLELSGAKQQIAHMMDTSYNTTFQLQLSKIQDDKIRQDLESIIKETLNFNKIYPPIVKEFQKRYNRKHAVSAISWLKSPLGDKMTKAELTKTEPSETLLMTEFQSLSDKRRGLFEKFVQTINSTEWFLKIISVSIRELADGMQPYRDTKEKRTPEQLEAYINDAINTIPKEQFTLALVASYAYVYRGLSDEELAAVIRFYESPAGKWFNSTFCESLVAGIGNASRECGKKLGRYMEELKKHKQGV